MERKLTKPRDFQRFSGQKAKIVTHEPVEDQKYWEGVLRGTEGEQIVIEPSEGRMIHIPLAEREKSESEVRVVIPDNVIRAERGNQSGIDI